MRRGLFLLLAGWLAIIAAASGRVQAVGARQEPATAVPPAVSPQRALLNRYCVTCHNEKLRTAGLTLDTMDVATVSADAEVWEKVVRKLRSGAMPPPGRPRPDQASYAALASYLETSIDRAAAANPRPGRTETFHRLNRAEYQNAIRDLLALELDVAALLPADDADQHGFNNMAHVLSVSPALLERYVTATHKVARLAVADRTTRPVVHTYNVPKLFFQDDRVHEDLPFGSRGGIAIRHYFPVDGEYTAKIRLLRNYNDYIKGIAEPHQLEVRLDGVANQAVHDRRRGEGQADPSEFRREHPGGPGMGGLHARSGRFLRSPLPRESRSAGRGRLVPEGNARA